MVASSVPATSMNPGKCHPYSEAPSGEWTQDRMQGSQTPLQNLLTKKPELRASRWGRKP